MQRDVLCNMNTEVEFILSSEDANAPYSWEDVENIYTSNRETLYTFIEESLDAEEVREILEEFGEESLNDVEISDLQRYLEDAHRFETEPAEIFEWWRVSSWLCEKLEQHGECVIADYNIWGRCTSGQAILLDPVISEIAEEMEILDGMESDWGTK